MKPSARSWILISALIAVFAAGLLILPASPVAGESAPDSTATRMTAATERETASVERRSATGEIDQLSAAFERVAEQVAPSVVSISSVKKVDRRPQARRAPQPFPFRDFFGDDLFDRFFRPRDPGQGYAQQGLGSGFVLSADGYVLTNRHVIDGADEVTVTIGGEDHPAEVVGGDARTDLAVLKIDASGLVPLPLGDSDELKVGQWVVAIGNPFGLDSTITAGIVSAKGRSRVGLADYEDFIQTDAAINPGNSGGPLVDLAGRVVGVNTAIFSRSGGYMGIGFAIPINMARSVTDSLIAEGRVVRGYLGVTIQDLDADMAASFGYDSAAGALVGDVEEGGPAEKAGLRSGDIITRFDGRPVESVDQLRLRVAEVRPDTEVTVTVFRDGESKTLRAKLGELPSDVGAVPGAAAEETDRLGMSYRTLTDDVARQLGYDVAPRGVVVTRVEPFGPAARAGLRVRDVILEVGDQKVEDAEGLNRELRRHDLARGVRLTVLTGQTQRFVFLRVRD